MGLSPIDIVINVTDKASGPLGAIKNTLAQIPGWVLDVGKASIQMSGDFEAFTSRFITEGGESTDQIEKIRQGILDMAQAVGTSPVELAKGFYPLEAGLAKVKTTAQLMAEGMDEATASQEHARLASERTTEILGRFKATAQGAKVGFADLKSTGEMMSGTMKNFGMETGQSTKIMSELIEAVGVGHLQLGPFNTALGNILPVAQQAKIGLAEASGGVALMTAHGWTAARASQNLAFAIRALQSPSMVATKAMDQIGIKSEDLAAHLGERGLAGSMQIIYKAMKEKFGDAATTTLKSLSTNKQAFEDLGIAVEAMPPKLQDLTNSYMAGEIGMTEYRKSARALGGNAGMMAQDFQQLYNKATGFNEALKSGQPMTVTSTALLVKMMGGVAGLNSYLTLVGQDGGQEFTDVVGRITEAGKKGAKEVNHWADIQKNFNFQMSSAAAGVDTAKVALGNVLLPIGTKLMDEFINPAIKQIPTLIDKFKDFGKQISDAFGKFASSDTAKDLMNKAASAANAIATHGPNAAIALLSIAAGLWAINAAAVVSEFLVGLAAAISGIALAAGAAVAAISAPVLLIGAAVALLVAGAILLVTHWKQVESAFGKGGQFEALGTTLRWLGDYLGKTFTHLWDELVKVWNTQLLPSFRQLWEAISPLVPGFLVIAGVIGGLVVAAFAILLAAVVGVARGIATFVQGIAIAIGGVVQIFTGLVQFFEGAFEMFYAIFTLNGDMLHKSMEKMANGIKNVIGGLVMTIYGLLVGTFGAIINTAKGFVESIIHFFQGLYNTLVGHSIVPDMVNGIIEWFQKLPGRVMEFVKSMVDKVTKAIGDLKDDALAWGKSFIQNFIDGINSMIDKVKGAAGNLAKIVGDFLKPGSPTKEGPGRTLPQWGKGWASTFAESLTAGAPLVRNAMQKTLTGDLVGPVPTGTLLGAGGRGAGQGGQGGLTLIIQPGAFTGNVTESEEKLASIVVNKVWAKFKTEGLRR